MVLIHVEVTEDVYKSLAEKATKLDVQIGEYCAALLIYYDERSPKHRIEELEAAHEKVVAAQKEEMVSLRKRIAELEPEKKEDDDS